MINFSRVNAADAQAGGLEGWSTVHWTLTL
jgi:hypothetical protein